ncbi:MAG: hypothetical protein RLZZ116_687 [Planctomycetota bacterium]|jgi:hypothetical protein
MNSKTTNLILTTALVALAAPAHAQVRAVKVVPAQTVPAQAIPIAPGQASIRPDPVDSGDDAPIDPAASVIPGLEKQGMDAVPPAAATPFSPAEIEELKKLFASLEEPEQAEMRAYYADFGIDLDAALGLAAERNADVQRGQMISNFMREMDFTRKPEAVLAARAKLGFGGVAQPNPTTAQPMEVARWIHLQVMAGEWATFASFMRARPLAEAEPVYAAILQAMNRGEMGLLPEEVLALTDAAPSDFKPWQMQALSRMLQQASAKYSTGAMLAAVRAGTRFFGAGDEDRSRRTVEFLAGAGLLAEAYEFLPSLDAARAKANGAQMIVHARYKLDLAAKAGEGPEGEALRLEAFRILAETSLLPSENTDRRREALKLAIGQMNSVPKVQVSPWLAEVFASPALGPAALEQIALSASQIGNMQVSEEARAKATLNLKESVDVLLAREDIDTAALRVPLRMVTTALVAEMEKAIEQRGQQQFIGRNAQLLYRAIPSEKWLKSLEPSLATRARKACIAIATVADETDHALALLDASIKSSPAEAPVFADHFLSKWVVRLRPSVEYPPEMMAYFSFYRDANPMAPLTRGRQRRNLDRLDALVASLREGGIEPRALPSIVPAFQACHATTEVYERANIERVFGPFDKMPPATALNLAMTMGGSLNGDWRSRDAMKATGTKRSDSEIAQLVDRGYGVAIALIESAVRQRPDAWNLAVIQAALTYDRLQFKQSQKTAQDPTQANEYRKAAFEAFADAARRYVGALTLGETRDDPGVYRRWFGAAMGTAELNFLRPDDLPKEGTLQDDQIDLIRKSMQSMEPEAYDRHVAQFSSDIEGAITRADPEVKPRLVRHALRVIGDHEAGASLRAMEELYRDLVKDEIKLRLAVDGSDQVGVGKPFGVLLSLRFTNSVDRETGGFSKYLQNGFFGRVGAQYRQINYRDELQKRIEDSFGKDFEVSAVGFFDAFMPPRGVIEEGQEGWLEKPLAYIVLTRKDPAIDTVPAVSMDMQFTDQTGPVTLAIPSNTPLLAAGEASTRRACTDLEISQLVDVRSVGEATGNGAKDEVTLEVRMRGKGVVPDVREALAGLDAPIAGYALANDGIVADPPIVLASGDASSNPMMMMRAGGPQPPKEGYPEPDKDGMYRLPIERSFKVTYVRGSGAIGDAFTLPTLVAGVDAKLESRFYDDLDIMPVEGASVAVTLPTWTTARIVRYALYAVLGFVVAVWWHRRKRVPVAAQAPSWAPSRITPLGVVTGLRRLEQGLPAEKAKALRDEIVLLELKYFGPNAGDSSEQELRAVVEKWQKS